MNTPLFRFATTILICLISSMLVHSPTAQAQASGWEWVEGGPDQYEVWTITPAVDGFVWLGTSEGLWRVGDERWTHTVPQDGNDTTDKDVLAILQDQDGVWWFGTWGGGIARLDGEKWLPAITTESGLPSNFVRALHQDRLGAMWIGTAKGLARLHREEWMMYGNEHGQLGDNDVRALLEDRQGHIWVGTNDGGVSRYDGTSWQTFAPPNLGGRQVNSITQDSDGAIWFATWPIGGLGGVTRYVPDDIGDGEWTTFDTSAGLPANGVMAVYQSSDGTLWFGTSEGVSRQDGLTWHTYDAGNGLASETVLSIAEDAQGRIWLGTDRGIARYTPKHAPLAFRLISDNNPAPEAISLFQSNRLALSLEATSEGSTPIFYRYRLLGLDSEWRVTESPALDFGRLEPGDYTLEVVARDADFNYSSSVRLDITVNPGRAAVISNIRPTLETIAATLITLAVLLLAIFLPVGFLVWLIRRQQPRRALSRHFNPYISGKPIVRGDLFFGRDEILKQIVECLHSSSVMLKSEAHIGKTTVLIQLMPHLQKADNPTFEFIPVFMDLHDTSQERMLSHLMEEMEAVFQALLPEDETIETIVHDRDPSFYGCLEFKKDLESLLTALRRTLRKEARPILLLDGFEEISRYDPFFQEDLRHLLAQLLTHNIGAVVTGSQPHAGFDEVPWHNLFHQMQLEPLHGKDAVRLITEPVRGIYRWDREAAAFIAETSGGYPDQIQHLCREAVNLMLSEGQTRICIHHVQHAHSEMQTAWDVLRPTLAPV